ncbi:phospholipase A1-like [Culicoides brevitarsis]|uniref:phospholipase A1-like n=1 Tax=Culicoides brevitarsis TaxID=469753 RepID=UPI00307B7C63
MIIRTFFALFLTNFVVSSPISSNPDQTTAALNTYLYGEPNPEWLKYINDDGYFDPSLIEDKETRQRIASNFTDELRLDFNAVKDVKFYLYTNKERSRTEIAIENLVSLTNSTFDAANPTRFLIHGWQDSEDSKRIQPTKDAYLEIGDFNVITVDWSKGASSLNYYTSRHRIEDVAGIVRRFIVFIVQNAGVTVSQLQVVGHSLGAHIAGLTGKYLHVGKLPVIVGLDPASPLFSMKNEKGRLTPNDAEYVEVIHSNGGQLGFLEPIGTSDFYPNYGRDQKGCGVDLTGACSHNRVCTFFAESIVTEVGFWAYQCEDFNDIKKKKCKITNILCEMGGEPLKTTRAIGNYYLETNKKKPYAMGLVYET